MPSAQHAGTASVVTQLLAFLREPARHRPRYTAGRESLEDGHQVLRIAQGKFPPGLMHDTSSGARDELQQAARAFIREVCFWEGATHYQALCLAPEASREAIKENYHLMMALIHPDRRDGAPGSWPKDCAQRVNLAYDVLGDEPKRRDYDAGLARTKPAASAPPRHAPRRAGHHARAIRWPMRMARALVVLFAVIVTLLVFGMWQGDLSGDTALLREWGSRSRALVASSERPRFLAPGATRDADLTLEEKQPVELPILTPLLRKLAIKPAADSSPAPAPAQSSAKPAPSAPPRSEAAEAPPLMQTDNAPPPAPRIAQSQPQPAPVFTAASKLTPQEIEMVVVRLIGYYEAGDPDKLMGLLDAKDRSFAESARIRTVYADFFRATKQRTLRLSNIDWQTSDGTAHARGEALLQAEYFGEATLERKVSLELDIALREGQAKITRLALFPNTP